MASMTAAAVGLFRRWGLLHNEPDYLAVAERVNQTALYREAAAATTVGSSEFNSHFS